MTTQWKFLIAIAISGISIFGGYQFYERQFSSQHIYLKSIETTPHPIDKKTFQQLSEIFNQPFIYLDRGKQTYVFESQDHHYVIKFFDFHRMQRRAKENRKETSEANMEKRLKNLLSGYQLAYERNRKNSAILFLQLFPNPLLNLEVTVKDRFGIIHEINLSKVPFVVQYKAIPSGLIFKEIFNKGDIKKGKHYLNSIVDMYLSEYRQGLCDADHNFMYNTGFIGEKPIRIDVGRLFADDSFKNSAVFQRDLEKIAIFRVSKWMKRYFPKYHDEIITDMHEKIQQFN